LRDLLCDGFQQAVEECLVRHRSILDVLSKLQESSARINRAVSKTVTTCGCLHIHAHRQQVPPDVSSLQEMRRYMETHLEGNLCEHCKEVLEQELGSHLFYLAALCNLLDLNLYDIFVKEHQKISMLGPYSLA
jgi:hypothetical protein